MFVFLFSLFTYSSSHFPFHKWPQNTGIPFSIPIEDEHSVTSELVYSFTDACVTQPTNHSIGLPQLTAYQHDTLQEPPVEQWLQHIRNLSRRWVAQYTTVSRSVSSQQKGL